MRKDNQDKANLWVKWGILLHCGLPILILLLLGFNGVNIPTSTWIFIIITVVVINLIVRRKHQ